MEIEDRLRGSEHGGLPKKAFVVNELEGPRLLGEEVTPIRGDKFLRVKERLSGGVTVNYYKATEKSVREQADIEDKLREKGVTTIDNAVFLDRLHTIDDVNKLASQGFKQEELDLT